ncbi:unnamed protein product, partial [Prorocentrum cordatum]
DLDYGSCRAGDALPAVLLQQPTARYLLLYFHSNGEDVGWCYQFGCDVRSSLEVHVLLVEYPGYGISPGPQALRFGALPRVLTISQELHRSA